MKVVGVTGTSGKTTTVEFLHNIFFGAGFKTSSFSSERFKILNKAELNLLKMTMPGRFKIQKFLKEAKRAGSEYVFLETTSEGIKQYRHKFIKFYAAIFTNLSPEHLESHGGFLNYKKAKLQLFKRTKRVHIINLDSEYAEDFLGFEAEEKWGYTINFQFSVFNFQTNSKIKNINLMQITGYETQTNGIDFEIEGQRFHSNLIGEFNLYNLLVGIAFARSQNISWDIIKKAIEKFNGVSGRMEFIEYGQPFKAVVDYAHTPDSLEAVYKTLARIRISESLFHLALAEPSETSANKLICVLGSAGGGRDKWKRPVLGGIAAEFCRKVFITNEDPYDDDPMEIINAVAGNHKDFIKILDRREVIREAFKIAGDGDCVIITGKGAEPWIMGPRGIKIPWDDREVAREELKKLNF